MERPDACRRWRVKPPATMGRPARALALLALVAACEDGSSNCDAASDACDTSGPPFPRDTDPPTGLDPDQAPPQGLRGDIHDGEGTLLRTWRLAPTDAWSATLSQGVFLLSGSDDDNTSLRLTLWADPSEGGSWSVVASSTDPQTDVANVVFLDAGTGGPAANGTLTVSTWEQTTEPTLVIASGALTLQDVTTPGDATFRRELRQGTFEGLRVTINPF